MQNISRKMNPTMDATITVSTGNNATSNVTGSDVTIATNNLQAEGGDCILLQFEEYVPWNNSDNLLSADVEATADRIKNTIVLPIFFLIGGPANVINMAVFWKQGVRERINLCLFSLSLADELYLIQLMFINGERIYTQFSSKDRYGPVTKFMTNYNLVGFYGLTWVSQVMSAIIASERCFCVVSPLRSQHVLSTRTMGVIIAGVYVTVVGVYFVVASRYHISCVLDPVTGAIFNAVVGGEFYHRNKKFIDYLDSLVYGVGLPGIVIVVVISTTIVTTVKLRQSAAWRAAASSVSARTHNNKSGTCITNANYSTAATENISVTANDSHIADPKRNASKANSTMNSREVALTKMLIAASVLFIVCVTPISLLRFSMLFVPELTAGGRQHNTFFFTLWILEVLSIINSSFNIVVYYTMGSRFRQTTKDVLFGGCRRCGCAGMLRRFGTRGTQVENTASLSDITETSTTVASSNYQIN